MDNIRHTRPLAEGFWTVSDGGLSLLGHRCASCGEVFFPRRKHSHCPHCFRQTLEEINLGPEGCIVSFSIVMIAPAGEFYRGPVPYAYGCVDFPVGVRIKGLMARDDLDTLDVGITVTLTVETLYVSDEGMHVETFVFKPQKNAERKSDEAAKPHA
ncbi:MAG: OB-fold domain-containing protein [Deltaproteobacteria bacterium]|nr:OB-fold domain-containing protein [Deltaproteobacteria bacterium]